jgi:hypothetical protein
MRRRQRNKLYRKTIDRLKPLTNQLNRMGWFIAIEYKKKLFCNGKLKVPLLKGD